jgi:hypothetical protein
LAITGGVENAENGSESGLIWCNSQAVTFFVTLAFSAFSYSHLKWDNSNLKWDTLSFKVGRNILHSGIASARNSGFIKSTGIRHAGEIGCHV